MLNRKMKPLGLAIGAAFAVSAATGLAVADEEELFEARVLDGVVLADAHGGEGKCSGEGKCGDDKEGDDDGEGDGDGDGDGDEESEEETSQ